VKKHQFSEKIQKFKVALREMRALTISVVGVCLAVLLCGIVLDDSVFVQTSELLYGRSSTLAGDLDFPTPLWSSKSAQQNMYNNIGAGDLKIDDTIKSIKSMQHEPELAASIHMLESASKRASDSMDDLSVTGSTLLHTPILPDPEGMIARLRRLRLQSGWCRKHPELCSDSPDVSKVIGEQGDDSDESTDQKASIFKNRDKRILAARTEQLWNEPDDGTQLFTRKDIKRMPWLSTYADRRKKKLEEDPLWCGASHCTERGYARHRHRYAQVIPHAIAVNQPLEGRRSGDVATDPHEKRHFSYARAPQPAGGLRAAALRAAPARVQALAELPAAA
jgi:hypothetical protein